MIRIEPLEDASGEKVSVPTPEQYVAANADNKVVLAQIRRTYQRNAQIDPRPDWQQIWTTALQRFDDEIARRGIPL